MPKKILVVDDEKPISDIIKFNLTKEGFDVDTAYDGEEAVQKVDEYDPDLMILDLMLPKKDGLEVAREVRQTHDMPIIMVTAKDTEIDKVLGLEMGADDYVTKPFSTEELLARIRSLLRRKGEVIDSTLSHGDLSLHLKSAELSSGINTVKLALKEFLIMEMLLQNPHQIITKERIIDKIWGGDSEAEYNNVEVYISFLRKKIQFLGAETEIRTSRGIGYSLE